MQFKFIITLDAARNVIVEADIDKLSVDIRGKKTADVLFPEFTEFYCESCRIKKGRGEDVGACRAANNIFELCKYFASTKSIDMIDMTVVQNNKCISHSTRKADDALLEILIVIIAASGCSRFGRVRWAWRYWNYECKPENLFYNLFSSLLVLECVTGEGKEPIKRAIELVHQKIAKTQHLIREIIEHVRDDFAFRNADATSNALVSIWTIGDIIKLRTDAMIEQLKELIESTQPEA